MKTLKRRFAMKMAHKMRIEEIRKGGVLNSFSYHLRHAWQLARQIEEVDECVTLVLVWKEAVTNCHGTIKAWKNRMIEHTLRNGVLGFLDSKVSYPVGSYKRLMR